MSGLVQARTAAALNSPRIAAAITALTAGGSGDATAIAGTAIDRKAIGMPLNAIFSLFFTATLAQAATLSFGTVKIQDSADGTTFADFLTYTDPGVVATGPTGGGTVNGQVNLAANLAGAKQYIKVFATPDLSAANTDTAKVCLALEFAGFDRLPSP